jgi:hypothetical protein
MHDEHRRHDGERHAEQHGSTVVDPSRHRGQTHGGHRRQDAGRPDRHDVSRGRDLHVAPRGCGQDDHGHHRRARGDPGDRQHPSDPWKPFHGHSTPPATSAQRTRPETSTSRPAAPSSAPPVADGSSVLALPCTPPMLARAAPTLQACPHAHRARSPPARPIRCDARTPTPRRRSAARPECLRPGRARAPRPSAARRRVALRRS